MSSWFRRFRSKADPIPAAPKSIANPTKSTPCMPSTPGGTGIVPRHDGHAIDYLATPAAAAYFDAREHEAYYQALKHAGPRRDFQERFAGILERFIELTDSPLGAATVDRVMAESLHIEESAKEAATGTSLDFVRKKCPRGIKLLGLTEPLTFDSLKSAYRNAAHKNHPDAGGSHEAMVAVNEAYCFAHALLRAREMGVATPETGGVVAVGAAEIRDCAAYRYKCGEWLFLIGLDDWNVDRAFTWLERITSDPWQESPYARHPWRRIALTEPVGKLVVRLSLAHLRNQAVQALAIARRGLQEAQKCGLNYEPYVREPEEILAGRKRAQVVLNHRRQAGNALRLGVIDEKRYRKTLERLALSVAAESMYEEELRRFQATGGFLRNLPPDHIVQGKTLKSELVPEPGYYVTRIGQLNDDQQAEYVIAFSDRTTLPLVRKYTFVRFMSLLESALFYPGQVDDSAVEREARTLASLHEGSGRYYGSEVAEVVTELRHQPLSERQARAQLLKEIEQGAGRVIPAPGITVTITFGTESPLGMPLTPDYFKVIRLSLPELRAFKRAQRGSH